MCCNKYVNFSLFYIFLCQRLIIVKYWYLYFYVKYTIDYGLFEKQMFKIEINYFINRNDQILIMVVLKNTYDFPNYKVK